MDRATGAIVEEIVETSYAIELLIERLSISVYGGPRLAHNQTVVI